MKPNLNKERYREILRSMSPQQKLEIVFELSDLANAAMKAGLRSRYPDLSDAQLEELYFERIKACHNQNY